MDVAVTGASGTLGSYLIRELVSAGHSVTCLSRSRPRATGIDFVQGDILDAEALRRALVGRDAAIHLAAITGPHLVPVLRLMEVNILGTVNVLEEAVKAGVGTLVFASTGAATGFALQDMELLPRYLPIDEEHPSEPHEPYGLSKLMGETACARYTRDFGLRTICLRVYNTWCVDHGGASQAMGTSGWAKDLTVEGLWERYREALIDPDSYRPNRPPAPRRGLWSFADARDVAQAFRLAVESKAVDHEVVLIAGDETCSLEETPALLAAYYPGVPVRLRLVGHGTLVSHERARQVLGYHPQYSWRDSDFAEWLRSRSPGLI